MSKYVSAEKWASTPELAEIYIETRKKDYKDLVGRIQWCDPWCEEMSLLDGFLVGVSPEVHVIQDNEGLWYLTKNGDYMFVVKNGPVRWKKFKQAAAYLLAKYY